MPGDPPNYFSYSKVFDQPGTVFYTSGSRASTKRVSAAGMSGVVTVLRPEENIFGIRKCATWITRTFVTI